MMKRTYSLLVLFVVAIVLLIGTLSFHSSLRHLFYVGDWVALTETIDSAEDIQSQDVQKLLAATPDAKFLADLGECFVLGDSLWVRGERLSDSGVLYSFDVTNESNSPVQVEDISTSCGCASGDMVSREILPGQSTKLMLTISHEKLSDGPHNYWVALSMSNGEAWRYGVKVKVVRSASWGQNDVYFGDVSGATTQKKHKVSFQICQPPFLPELEFSGVHASNSLLSCEVLGCDTHAIGNGFLRKESTVELTLDPASLPREGQGGSYLTARYKLGTEDFESKIRVHWEKISAYSITPARLIIKSNNNALERIDIVASHVSGVSFRVLGVDLPSYLQLDTDLHSGASVDHRISLVMQSELFPVTHDFSEVTIRTDIEGDDLIKVPVAFLRIDQ